MVGLAGGEEGVGVLTDIVQPEQSGKSATLGPRLGAGGGRSSEPAVGRGRRSRAKDGATRPRAPVCDAASRSPSWHGCGRRGGGGAGRVTKASTL